MGDKWIDITNSAIIANALLRVDFPSNMHSKIDEARVDNRYIFSSVLAINAYMVL